MSPIILYSVLTLGGVAALAAVMLLIAAKQFYVEEDPRIDVVAELLPGANCGACGAPGCRGFSEMLIKAANQGDISGKVCPVSTPEDMARIGEVLGLEIAEVKPMVAVVRCGGLKNESTQKLVYDGPLSCMVAGILFSGENGCSYGCFGLGDCVKACGFDAIKIDQVTGLPVVDEEKCAACGVCVTACPRKIIELRPVGKKEKRVWVNCLNYDKGGAARKVCSVACIGCGKCVRACPDKISAITLENNLAYINPDKCIACGKCFWECPTNAIKASFEVPKPKPKKKVNGEKSGTKNV